MDPNSLAYDLLNAISRLSGPAAYCTIVGVLLACGLGVPIPEDITLLSAGLLASAARISIGGALIAGFIGVLIGDSILFFAGRFFGKRLFSIPGIRRLFTPERLAKAEARIRVNGPFICFVARFLPGLRSPVFAMSGALGVKKSTFFLLDGFAALLSVPLWIYLGFWFGQNFDDAFVLAKRVEVYIFASVGTLVMSYIFYKFVRRRHLRRAQSPQA